MAIDPNSVSIYTVGYFVKTGYADIISSFNSVALDLDDYKKMAEVLGENVDARYVNELVSIWGSVQKESYDNDTNKVGDGINGNISNSYSGILTLSVTANSREVCVKLADIADAAIMEHLDKLHNAGIEVNLSSLSSAYIEVEDQKLASYHREIINEGSEVVGQYNQYITDVKKNLDEDELNAFEYLINKDQGNTDHVH